MRVNVFVIMSLCLLHTMSCFSRYNFRAFSYVSKAIRPLSKLGGICVHIETFKPRNVIARCTSTQSGINCENLEEKVPSPINIKVFRTEIDRGLYRMHKKLTKANERLGKLNDKSKYSVTEQEEVMKIIKELEESVKAP